MCGGVEDATGDPALATSGGEEEREGARAAKYVGR